MAPYVKVSSNRFQVDLQKSHFSILNSTSSAPDKTSSRPKSTYWGRIPGQIDPIRTPMFVYFIAQGQTVVYMTNPDD